MQVYKDTQKNVFRSKNSFHGCNNRVCVHNIRNHNTRNYLKTDNTLPSNRYSRKKFFMIAITVHLYLPNCLGQKRRVGRNLCVFAQISGFSLTRLNLCAKIGGKNSYMSKFQAKKIRNAN